ncbi:hypothetical protein L2755_18515 [Shewanella abyssi]|uniref:hypothetical protein n=1 Tax=Shewanella abyssi TaxID=311789 RepID=UPI00200E5F11|nr:hypothetical protein [Shewanella abyssi]MCL1051607.1 hypothetical protein [Shewanella abyssi]
MFPLHNNLANDSRYAEELLKHRNILNPWIAESNDLGQYPEREESLTLMLGICGDTAINPEYEALRKKYPQLSGSQYPLKNARFEKVEKL